MDELAEHLGVTRQAVWYWETGQRIPRAGLFEKIAAEFGVTEGELLEPSATESLPNGVLHACKSQIASVLGVSVENVSITVRI